MSTIVKCPICEDRGGAKVYPLGCSATLIGYYPYHDEEGVYHDHNPNATTSLFCCDKGHSWQVKTYATCPGCGWRRSDDVIIVPTQKES